MRDKKVDKTKKKAQGHPLKHKAFVLAICIPFFPITLIGKWYENAGGFGYHPFSFWGETVEYWCEVIYVLTDFYDVFSKGMKYNKQRVLIKKRRRFAKRVKERNTLESVKSQLLAINKQLNKKMIIMSFDHVEEDYVQIRFERGDGWGNGGWYCGLIIKDKELMFYKFNDYEYGKKTLESSSSIDDVYTAKRMYTEKPITQEELDMIILNYTDKKPVWKL